MVGYPGKKSRAHGDDIRGPSSTPTHDYFFPRGREPDSETAAHTAYSWILAATFAPATPEKQEGPFGDVAGEDQSVEGEHCHPLGDDLDDLGEGCGREVYG